MADELLREEQLLAEDRLQHIDVLASRHTAEQYYLAARSNLLRQLLCVSLQRIPIPRFIGLDRNCREPLDVFERDHYSRRTESIGRRDDVHAGRLARWGILEGPRVVQLAAEIEPAQEAEDLPKWRAFVAADPLSDRKLRPGVRQNGGLLSAAAGR